MFTNPQDHSIKKGKVREERINRQDIVEVSVAIIKNNNMYVCIIQFV